LAETGREAKRAEKQEEKIGHQTGEGKGKHTDGETGKRAKSTARHASYGVP
jgi:hypothetical protein